MALTKWQPPTLRRESDSEVVWLELFFDLVYVAALIQLGDRLADDVSPDRVAWFAGVFAILWWTWTGTTAFMNRYAVDDVRHRALVFAQMFAVGSLAVVAVGPIDNRSTWMVVAYVAARLPLLAMYWRIRNHSDASRRLAGLYLGAFGTGVGLWLISLGVPEPGRYVIWAAALAIEFAAPIVGLRRLDPPPTNQHHFRERYALFTIIVLGESFVKTLTELSGHGLSLPTQVFGVIVFLISAALWWTYFDDVADSEFRPGNALTGLVWVYAHLPLTMALTALGVASKKMVVIESFGDDINPSYAWLLVSAIGVALIATAILDATTVSPHFAVGTRLRVGLRIGAAAAVTGAPLVFGFSPALTLLAAIGGIVILQIAVEVLTATVVEVRTTQRMAAELVAIEGSCAHLSLEEWPEPEAASCDDCRRTGQVWVELRACLVCGEVGCCDDSIGQHARAHYQTEGHVVMMSLEDGADWAYCYADDVVQPDWQTQAAASLSDPG